MCTRVRFLGLIAALLFMAGCDMKIHISIPSNGGLRGYGPSGLPDGFAYDTLQIIAVELDTIERVNDTLIWTKFHFTPNEEVIVLNVGIRMQNIEPVMNGEYVDWDMHQYRIDDFTVSGCYEFLDMNIFDQKFNVLIAKENETYDFCFRTWQLNFAGYVYRITILVWVIKPESTPLVTLVEGHVEGAHSEDKAIGGKGVYYYSNP